MDHVEGYKDCPHQHYQRNTINSDGYVAFRMHFQSTLVNVFIKQL